MGRVYQTVNTQPSSEARDAQAFAALWLKKGEEFAAEGLEAKAQFCQERYEYYRKRAEENAS